MHSALHPSVTFIPRPADRYKPPDKLLYMFEEDDHTDPGSLDTGTNSDTVHDTCGCAPEYKETEVIQESMGMTLGLFGGQIGIGDTVVICKNCHKLYAVEDTRGKNNHL